MPARFHAYFRDEDSHRSSPVRDAVSAEDAAIGFLECHHLAESGDNAVAIIVIDHDTGGQHCFRVDIASGEAAPCD